MKEAHDHRRVTPEGKAIGEQVARLTETMVNELEQKGISDQRCKTCAFRQGTVPNGCIQTQADALKCVMEGNLFICHQNLKNPTPCFGYMAARAAIIKANDGNDVREEMPWKYSHEHEDEA